MTSPLPPLPDGSIKQFTERPEINGPITQEDLDKNTFYVNNGTRIFKKIQAEYDAKLLEIADLTNRLQDQDTVLGNLEQAIAAQENNLAAAKALEALAIAASTELKAQALANPHDQAIKTAWTTAKTNVTTQTERLDMAEMDLAASILALSEQKDIRLHLSSSKALAQTELLAFSERNATAKLQLDNLQARCQREQTQFDAAQRALAQPPAPEPKAPKKALTVAQFTRLLDNETSSSARSGLSSSSTTGLSSSSSSATSSSSSTTTDRIRKRAASPTQSELNDEDDTKTSLPPGQRAASNLWPTKLAKPAPASPPPPPANLPPPPPRPRLAAAPPPEEPRLRPQPPPV